MHGLQAKPKKHTLTQASLWGSAMSLSEAQVGPRVDSPGNAPRPIRDADRDVILICADDDLDGQVFHSDTFLHQVRSGAAAVLQQLHNDVLQNLVGFRSGSMLSICTF